MQSKQQLKVSSPMDVEDVAGGAELQKVVSGSTSIEVTGSSRQNQGANKAVASVARHISP